MATYDYKCFDCDKLHVEKHGMMEEPTITCDCGGKTRRVILTAPSFDSYTPGFVHNDCSGRPRNH